MKRHHDIQIPAGKVLLWGDLHLPRKRCGIVAFAHGSGTSRRDPQNQLVARRLEEAGFATLLVELLEDCETHDRHNVFDIDLQAQRLVEVAEWLAAAPATRSLRLGLFGTGVGTGVALAAAAKAAARVSAVVSRGGRPDTALCWVPRVAAPTLFIADEGGADLDWIDMAYRAATAKKELVLVPDAGPLFHGPGAIEAVAEHARRWFARHLAAAAVDPDQNDRGRYAPIFG